MTWAVPAHAALQNYRYDTVHSQVLFSITHDGYSRPFGRLHVSRGWLKFDPDDWASSSTELDIDLTSLDMGDADWNRAVLKPALLDGAGHRYAHFASTSVERTGDRHGVLHGTLTLRGVSRPLDIAFTFNRLATTIYGMHTVAGFSGRTTLHRRDFGITAFANSIGDDVVVWLEIEAIRDDGADATPAPATPSGKEHP
ncbi:YceI family protein [Dyella sp.]|uniref:YceI family protein n=1 Tax=Dyella sp. TaxID=1869338 RepID=UPI002D7A0DD4|nr:YceI family protein [Dyella sp.]HET6431699.1 YceI family protein [Dyella sp.]